MQRSLKFWSSTATSEYLILVPKGLAEHCVLFMDGYGTGALLTQPFREHRSKNQKLP